MNHELYRFNNFRIEFRTSEIVNPEIFMSLRCISIMCLTPLTYNMLHILTAFVNECYSNLLGIEESSAQVIVQVVNSSGQVASACSDVVITSL